MKADELREAYLAFFESKGCRRLPSDVLVPRDDPTVLFTPAGMNQFKREFLGLGDPELKRATTCQKCMRTSDIDNVGRTAYHHTFFEMLGNFSFGDYFKREAIIWAWEFCTSRRWLGLPADRLSASVYEDDDEAAEIWRREVGLPEAKIARMGEEDNFWPAGAPTHGPDGVCGPCSEIFYHPPDGSEVEIWNLVFTQFQRVGPPPENLHPLPSKNIDTGMGLERTAAVLQGVESNFDIDIFAAIIEAISEIVSHRYGADPGDTARMRRIADHIRALTFCIHENVLPSNEKQGYVVRRLLRRAVLDGYQLGMRDPFLHQLCPVVVETMQRPYPELQQTLPNVSHVVRQEEEKFLTTLAVGVEYLDRITKQLSSSGDQTISGQDAFKLHATYGFPVELTESVAAERGLRVDRAAFDQLWQEHVERSGRGAFAADVFATGPVDQIRQSCPSTEFVGYQTTECEAVVRGIVVGQELVQRLSAGQAESAVLVLDRSPFYGEAGGQVGDSGCISSHRFRFEVTDTKRDGDLILHLGRGVEGAVQVGQSVHAAVQQQRRQAIRRAHSATHLLHYALRQVLGEHATQAGSKVDADYLRFDFTHPQAVATEQLQRIEDLVNQRVWQAVPVNWTCMPLEEAKRLGAMALFGEKYGETVRVVSMGDFSRELCGGTHLDNTGQIGLCRIVSEESVAAGTRRLVALTGPAALHHVRQEQQTLRQLSQIVRVPASELVRRVTDLVQELRALKKQLAGRRESAAGLSVDQLLASARQVGPVRIVAQELPGASPEQMRHQIDLLRRRASPIAVLLAARSDGKVQMVAGLSRELVERGIDAVQWIRQAAKIVGGGGGGRPDMAQAGGKDPSRIPEALKLATEAMCRLLQGTI